MKLSALFASLLIISSVSADTVHLTTGKKVTGKTTSYWNLQFEVLAADGTVQRCPLSLVQKIEFTETRATLEIRNKGKATGQLVGFENSTFILKNDKGETETFPAMLVKEASFGAGGGGGDAAKDVAAVTGSDLSKSLVAGKVTIVDFYADWCGPCRRIGPILEKLAKDDSEVVLRKVNVDQNSALAAKHGVRGIPHILVFDKAGKEIGKVVGADADGVNRLVAKAKGS